MAESTKPLVYLAKRSRI